MMHELGYVSTSTLAKFVVRLELYIRIYSTHPTTYTNDLSL